MTGGPASGPAPALVADPDTLHGLVGRVATEISADHREGVVLVGTLKGSLMFLADLARRVTVPARLDMIATTPYASGAPRTHLAIDLDHSVLGEQVVLVTDIVDTGLSTDFLVRYLLRCGAATVRVATLADKRARRLLGTTPDYMALDAPDLFLLGYGLGYQGRYRNLRGLWGVEPGALSTDPDQFVPTLYGIDP